MKNKKQFETILFSVVGVVAMFFLLIAVYFIAGVVKARVDLTADKLYTLSDGTKRILSRLDTPVEIRFYCTKHSKDMPLPLKNFAQEVEDLLDEYRKAGKGNIEIKKLDPEPDSDAEDSANLDGIEGQTINLGEKIYLGLAINQLDSKATLPFLALNREKLLEYDISRAISRVSHPQKSVIGVMSSLPVFGMPMNPMMMRMGQQGQEPWVFLSQLKQDYDVRQLEMNGEPIPTEVKLLLVVHPKAITDQAQYAIDQFLMRGGKLVAFLDPLSIVDSHSSGMNPLQAASTGGSNMEKLLKAWGITFDMNKVVADKHFVTKINRSGRVEAAPAVLSMTAQALNPEDIATGQIDNLLLPFTGAFSGTPAEGLQETVLVHSSKDSQLVERFMAEFSGEQIDKDFAASGKEYPLAIRLLGKFKTAFPEGKPKETSAENKPEEKKESKPAEASLKQSANETTVILVGDSDLLYDQFTVDIQNFFGQRIVVPRNANLDFLANIVDQLSGDDNLIRVRSRASMNRPFTVVRQMQAKAEEGYRSKIRDLEKSLQDAQTRLNELQRQKGEGGQRFILSPEQQAEITRFRHTETQTKRELKEVRKNLRRNIDSLETRLQWVNIAGMPFLVTVFGIALAMVKRKKTAAK